MVPRPPANFLCQHACGLLHKNLWSGLAFDAVGRANRCLPCRGMCDNMAAILRTFLNQCFLPLHVRGLL